jgi:AcrR family transcriptional regulator
VASRAIKKNGRGRPSLKTSAAITQQILERATELFSVEGYHGTTMEAVAAAANVPKTTVYKRFPDKSELAKAVLSDSVAKGMKRASQEHRQLSKSLPERLEYLICQLLTSGSVAEVRAIRRLRASAFPAGEDFDMLGRGQLRDYIAKNIRDYGPPLGIVAADPDRVAASMLTLTGGLLVRAGEEAISVAEAEEQAQFIVRLVMTGSDAW